MNQGMDADVLVVGAGPAGSAAAITLARSGKRVVMVDRAHFPRDKCCGDGLTGPALRQLTDLGVRLADLPSWQHVERSVFVSPSGRDLPLRTGDEHKKLLAIVTRAELDAVLVDLARDAGVRVIEGARLDSASVAGEMVTAHFAGLGELRAPLAIGADGAWSPLRRALDDDAPAQQHKWHAARAYVRGVRGPGSSEAFVWFDADVLPGYAWSFPMPDGRANVGVGALREAGGGGGWIVRRFEQLLASDKAVEKLGADAVADSRTMVWPIPTDFKRSRLLDRSHRVLFAGDAVGATDPMTGEGIAEALQTGELAGRASAAGRPRSYLAAARRTLAGRHRRRQFCSDLLRSRSLATAGIRVAGTNDWTAAQFTRWIFD
ncbi:MAG: NAD(P)/FAD-dependent oxidoreductase [Actinobacteria bacterium]|nr:NAD(P)/FAD-dependent oxidoreductase [Actinomycetota bacterium]